MLGWLRKKSELHPDLRKALCGLYLQYLRALREYAKYKHITEGFAGNSVKRCALKIRGAELTFERYGIDVSKRPYAAKLKELTQ